MEIEEKDINLLYIQEELSQHGEWLCDILAEAVEKRKLRDSGTLLDSINYKAFTENGNPGLRVSFFGYGRALDIAHYKRNRHQVDAHAIAWGQKENRIRKKNTRWYARNMYGGLNRLVSRIMYGLSDAEVERLKGILEQRNAASQNR